MPPRRPGTLLPFEVVILGVAAEAAGKGEEEFHGFALAEKLARGDKPLMGYGPLYRMLARLERTGLLASRWENAKEAMANARPRRRLYRITPRGLRALAHARATDPLLIHLRDILAQA